MKVLILILLLVFISGCSPELTEEDIREIVQLEITTYCDKLSEDSTGSSCPTCWSYGNQEMYDGINYNIIKEGDNYLVNSNLRIIYGRNTRDGDRAMEFIIDKAKNVISSSIEESTCLE
jgi:hypothetical protein